MISWRTFFRYSAKPAEVFARAERDGYDKALSWASRRLPPNLRHTLHLMRANRDRSDEANWSKHLGAYLANFNVGPVTLLPGCGPRIDRFTATGDASEGGGPLITVIMCAWNAESTIDMAARSVLGQSWKNLEFIIVDDASSDDTGAKIAAIAASDQRVTVITNPANVGPYVGRNLALGIARGSYVTCADADDWAHPNRIADQHRFARAGGLALAMGSMLRMQGDGRFTRFTRPSLTNPDGVLRQSFSSAFFDKDFLKNRLGYWDTVKFSGDSEMIERVRSLEPRVMGTDPKLSMIALDREDSLTSHPETGLNQDGSLSPVRKQYRASFKQWHDSGQSMMPFPQYERVFRLPPEMSVSDDNVASSVAARMSDRFSTE